MQHVLTAFNHGKHVINATVEADDLWPHKPGCSRGWCCLFMAYGDQPALACELVDQQDRGFNVVLPVGA